MHATLAFSPVTIVAVITSLLAYVFDWNETHVFNPNWPPHAKFHNAQTLMLGPLSGVFSPWQLWHKHDLHSSVLTSSLYWIAQLGSLAFPGTALIQNSKTARDLAHRCSLCWPRFFWPSLRQPGSSFEMLSFFFSVFD
jgi:hypothetical protein